MVSFKPKEGWARRTRDILDTAENVSTGSSDVSLSESASNLNARGYTELLFSFGDVSAEHMWSRKIIKTYTPNERTSGDLNGTLCFTLIISFGGETREGSLLRFVAASLTRGEMRCRYNPVKRLEQIAFLRSIVGQYSVGS